MLTKCHIIINGLMLTVDHYSCYSSQKYNKDCNGKGIIFNPLEI